MQAAALGGENISSVSGGGNAAGAGIGAAAAAGAGEISRRGRQAM